MNDDNTIHVSGWFVNALIGALCDICREEVLVDEHVCLKDGRLVHVECADEGDTDRWALR